jgi:hypothetical protein
MKIVRLSLDRMTDRQLLELRLCDLPIRIKGTRLEDRVQKLYREMASRSLAFRPHVWLGEEWFTPDGVAGFAIPFYLAHPRLMKLERSQMLEVEGASEGECMRILRHEAGHALDNAFKLHTRKTWTEMFGSYRLIYPNSYQPQPSSRDYVLNLDAWYAQAHPAEDFAETFAVWLQPGTRWPRQYEGWGARHKLEYVDRLMKQLAFRPPVVNSHRKVESLTSLKTTLREHYQKKRAYYILDWPVSYERNLYRLFSAEPRHRSLPSAAQFLRRFRRDICEVVANGTGLHRYTINNIMKRMIVRCRQLKLHLTIPEEDARQLVIASLTMEVVQVLQTGYHRIPL